MGSPPHLIKRLAWLLCLLLACTVLGPVAHAHQSYSRHGTALDPVSYNSNGNTSFNLQATMQPVSKAFTRRPG
jgi:hypothetical protein